MLNILLEAGADVNEGTKVRIREELKLQIAKQSETAMRKLLLAVRLFA